MATKLVVQGIEDFSTTAAFTAGDSWIITRGDQTISGNLAASGIINELASVRVMPEFHGYVGGGSYGPWQLGITGEFRNSAGGGRIQIQPKNTAGANADTIASLIHEGGGILDVVGGGTVTTVNNSGRLNIAEAVAAVTLNATGGKLDVGYNATDITTARITGGQSHIIRRGIVTLDLIGAELRMARQVAPVSSGTAAASGIVGTTYRVANGKLTWMGGAISGSIVLMNDNSKFDWTGMPLAATIASVIGTPQALINSGIVKGATTYTSINGAVMTVGAVTVLGSSVETYFGGTAGGGVIG